MIKALTTKLYAVIYARPYVVHNGPFKFPKEEIQQVRFFAKDKVLEFIRNDPDASLASKEEIPIVFEFLEKR